MLAVVLVGGEGTRLRPLTYTTPKSLLPICNQPFLERQLTWLARNGVDEVVLSMGYLPDAFHARFPDGRFGDVALRYAVEPEPLGTGGAIRFAADGADDTFIVCNGDVLTDLAVDDLLARHRDAGAEATIALTRVEDPSAFGVVPTAPDGRVLAFVEKPPPGLAPTDWINAGTYVLEPSMLDRIPAGCVISVERETFPRTLERGGGLYAVQSDAFWLDIGVPRQFLEAQQAVLHGTLGPIPVDAATESDPGVWTQDGAQIDEAARIVAPVLVGAGSVVGPGAVVEHSVIGAGCRIEAGATVSRSVVMDGARVAEGAMVYDSIADFGSDIGPVAWVTENSVIGAYATVDGGTSMVCAKVDPPSVPGPAR